MSNQVTLTIDGVQVTVPAGSGVVEAAKTVGIDIILLGVVSNEPNGSMHVL